MAKVRRWMTQCGEAEAVKVNARDADGYTAFHLAAKHNRLAVLRILAGLDRQKGGELLGPCTLRLQSGHTYMS